MAHGTSQVEHERKEHREIWGMSLQNYFQSGDLISSETSIKEISEQLSFVAVSTIISFPVGLTHNSEMLSPVSLASRVLLTYSNGTAEFWLFSAWTNSQY